MCLSFAVCGILPGLFQWASFKFLLCQVLFGIHFLCTFKVQKIVHESLRVLQLGKTLKMAIVAWLLVLVYYFYQYPLRSAPSVMIPQLSQVFRLNAFGVASIIVLFYNGYSPFSLITGVSLDRLGLKKVVPFGAVAVGTGAGMLPYTVIKEVNPLQFSGTATGVCNFITFTFSALLAPLFGWLLVRVSAGSDHFMIRDYRITFEPLTIGVGLAIFLTFFLKETGHGIMKK